MGYEGRHRAPTESKARLILPIALIALMPVSIGLGYYNLATRDVTQTQSVDPYAGTITVAASPPLGANHTTPPTTGPEKPTQSATESPVTTSTKPTPDHREKDQEAPQTSSAPVPAAQKTKVSPKCANLKAKQNVVRACNAIIEAFPQVSSMGGLGSRPNNPHSCHPFGLGLDVMVNSNSLGDSVNAWAHTNQQQYGIAYIGWEVPDHWDHVHLSFDPCKG